MVEGSDQPSCDLINPVLAEIEDEPELEAALADIKGWVGELRRDYEERVYPFAHLKFADRSIYPKHYPAAGLTRDQIVERTKAGDSLFFQEVTPEVLKRYMWNVFEMHCQSPLATEKDESLVMETHCEIGASKGQPTTLVRILFNRASGVVHMYPVPPTDAPPTKF